MKMIICIKKKDKAKILSIGNCLDNLTMVTVIVKTVIEKIAKERKITLEEARKVTLEMVDQAMELLRKE